MRIFFLTLACLVAALLPAQAEREQPSDTELAFDDLTMVRTALPYADRRRFKTVMFLYNSFDFNLNEHLQLSVGNAAILGLTIGQRYRTSLTPWLHLGLSNETLLLPTFLSLDEVGVAAGGDLTGMLTIGSQDQLVHFGAGMFYAAGEAVVPNFRVGVGRRLSPSVHLYGELIAVGPDDEAMVLLPSFNASLTRRRHRWSFGLATILIDEESYFLPPLPYLSYAVYY